MPKMKFLKSGDFGKIEENFHFNEKYKGFFFRKLKSDLEENYHFE
jgi:hypothetical protein